MDKVIYTCIGKSRIKNVLIPCKNTSETPTWRDVYLCPICANGRSSREETHNCGAMQADIEEYRDQITAGFAAGASRYYDGEFDSGE